MNEETLFELALNTPPAERAALLDRESADDPELRRRVEALLAADAVPKLMIDSPVDGTASYGGSGAEPGAVIAGRYTLVELIGEGGMGEVWVAKQSEPVKRKVALKLIKAGMDSKAVMQRFEAERQALALMDHPNIAKVLDGGMTAERRPFFVMELVNGLPLTKFCDETKLGIRERLELFASICQAVQHAHQKGIIHRDLKPSNILVTVLDGRPIPKIIDFGVAKAVGGRLTEESLSTQFGAVVGTFEYMSPEQAGYSATDVDTRADIYSLGVLLYELLTGLKPIDAKRLREAAMTEMIRIIKEEEPSKPSTRLSTDDAAPSLAALRHTEPKKLAALLRGELDWITMKCLEKDRTRRYETANGLSRDIQRFLSDEPVEAGPPTAGYRLRKFAKRNRVALMTATALALLLIAGVVTSTWHAARATRAEARALEERNHAQEARALADRNFQKARSAVESYLQKVADSSELKNNPRSHNLRKQLLSAALPFFEEFVKEKSDDPAVRFGRGKAYLRMANLRADIGERAAAIQDATAARDVFSKLVTEHPNLPEYRKALAESISSVGALLSDLNKKLEAEAAYREALDLREKLAAEYPDVPEFRCALASALQNLSYAQKFDRDLSKRADSAMALRRALAIREKLVADFPGNPEYKSSLAGTLNTLWMLLISPGVQPLDGESPIAVLRRSLAIREGLAAEFPSSPDHRSDLATGYHNLGYAMNGVGEYSEAVVAYRQAIANGQKLVADFPAVPDYRNALAFTHMTLAVSFGNWGKRTESEAAYHEAIRIGEKLTFDFPEIPEYRQRLANYFHNLGIQLRASRKLEGAEAAFRRELALYEIQGADFSDAVDASAPSRELGRVLRDSGKHVEAENAFRRAITILENRVAVRSELPETRVFRAILADTYKDLGLLLTGVQPAQLPEAEAALRKALALREKNVTDWPAFVDYKLSLAGSYMDLGNLLRDRGEVWVAQEWHDKAVMLFVRCYEVLKERQKTNPSMQRKLVYTIERLIEINVAANRPDEAAKWRKELEAIKGADQKPEKP